MLHIQQAWQKLDYMKKEGLGVESITVLETNWKHTNYIQKKTVFSQKSTQSEPYSLVKNLFYYFRCDNVKQYNYPD